MAWRDTMQQVLQGVMLPPQIPQNFQQPQSSIPLPPLGQFGQQALSMAGLPSSIPRRMVSPAELIRRLPAAPVPGGGGDRAAPVDSSGGSAGGGNTIDDILNGGMVPPTTETGIPIVAGNPSRIEPAPEPAPPAPIDYSQPMDPNAAPPAYVPDAPYTYQTPPNPGNVQGEAPYAPVMPGSTTTEHSDILNPGTTVGDLMGGGGGAPSVGDWMTNPFGSAADSFQNMVDEYRNPWMSSPLELTDPYSGSYGGGSFDDSNFDPFNLSNLSRAQRQYLYDIGYLRDA